MLESTARNPNFGLAQKTENLRALSPTLHQENDWFLLNGLNSSVICLGLSYLQSTKCFFVLQISLILKTHKRKQCISRA